jgi:putative endonuclease
MKSEFTTKRSFYVYILMNRRRTVLYIGLTSNLARRLDQHRARLVEGFTKKYNVDELVYYEVYEYINDAIAREKQLKKWSRQKKLDLIKKVNYNLKEILPV